MYGSRGLLNFVPAPARKNSPSHAPDEIGGQRQPMGSLSDLHGAPGHDLIPLNKGEALRDSGGFFFELQDLPLV
jgi:hypothetical protein